MFLFRGWCLNSQNLVRELKLVFIDSLLLAIKFIFQILVLFFQACEIVKLV